MSCTVDHLLYRGEDSYYLEASFVYYSAKYDKFKTVPVGVYDGATGAADVCPKAWLVHDAICNNPVWDDGTPIKAWQAANVLSEILKKNGRWFRARSWLITTFLFGCVKTRENGWI